MTDMMSESEKRVTDVVDLGVLGRVRIDNMFELYMETNLGDLLKFYQTRLVPSVGGWVYDAAACLAKYLETGHFLQSLVAPVGDSSDICKCRYPLRGKSFIELGAGTGIVGIMAGYYGADAVITDLESLVPLIQFNISANQPLMKGSVVGLPLIWGSDDHVHEAIKYLNLESFDYVVLANCVYYEGSLETLLQTTLDLTENKSTTVLACYEERTTEIKSLIARWHDLVERHFVIEDVPQVVFDSKYCKEYVRIVTMKRK